MIYKPFSVVVVPFPFTDKEQTKRRPAVVLSSVEHQEHTQHLTLLMITTAKNSSWSSDYLISSLESAGLSVPSIVRQKIFTIDSRLILKCIGALSSKDSDGIVKQLRIHLSYI